MLQIINAIKFIESVPKDKIMNQKVAFVTGNEKMSLFIIEIGQNQSLHAHYHKEGIEIYYVLSGEAILTTGAIMANEEIINNITQSVTVGDAFSIKPFVVHQITNLKDDKLQILVIAPKNHGIDDRYFVK